MKPSIAASLKRAFSQPTFVLVAAVLFLAALGLNAATQAMQLHFKKKAVPLAVPLHESDKGGVPRQMGHWLQVTRDEPLDHRMLEALGTGDFVFRHYVNTDLADPEVVRRLTELAPDQFVDDDDTVPEGRRRTAAQKENEQRFKLLAEISAQHPNEAAVLQLALTYYTGSVDTVPHIPDRCMIADGYEATNYDIVKKTFGAYADGQPREVEYRSTRYQDDTDQKRVDRNIIYFFHVNGRYESDPLGVRASLQDLRERYGYFAKIELLSTHPKREVAEAAMNDLMAVSLPEIERCLPDWEKVRTGQWQGAQ